MIQFLPEWVACDGILMALPNKETDWDYILDEALDQYSRIIDAMTNEDLAILMLCDDRESAERKFKDVSRGLVTFVEAPYNDTWTRDYGPLSVVKNGSLRCLDFGFNAWGLKFAADKDNLINRFLDSHAIISKGIYRNQSDFILEGGSIDTDGRGTILTTTRCLCSPNRNGGLTKAEAAEQLSRRLGASHILFLDYGALIGDDTDSHIDTLARLAPDNTIIFSGCRNFDDPQFEELLKMRAQLELFRNAVGEPFNLVELPLPDPIFDDSGNRLPATYANYLVTDRTLFMPVYSQPENDNLAMQTMKIAFPEHKVVGVECTTLLRQHGSLHCATMQIPEGIFSPVVFNK